MSVSYKQFKSQVIAYLPDEMTSQYDNKVIWEKMVIDVVDLLEAYLS